MFRVPCQAPPPGCTRKNPEKWKLNLRYLETLLPTSREPTSRERQMSPQRNPKVRHIRLQKKINTGQTRSICLDILSTYMLSYHDVLKNLQLIERM
jgi:hypothetical protein